MTEVEETPIIDQASGQIVPEAAQIFSETPHVATHPAEVKPKKKSRIGTVVFIVLLFGLGIWLSTQLRSFFAPADSEEVTIPTSAPLGNSSFPTPFASPSAKPQNTVWVMYQPLNGVSYKLPSTVEAPTCDGGSCPSKGTNLPNGTRFTVAARGKGQLLPDFRGAILTDAGGKEFVMKQTTIRGVSVYEYIGNFTGRTGGGYTFTNIRGVLVPVSDTLAIEFNHFAPLGVTSDFAKDDELFDQIIGTFTTSLPSPTIPTATSSGF